MTHEEHEKAPLMFAEKHGFVLDYLVGDRYLYVVQQWVTGIQKYTGEQYIKKPSKGWYSVRHRVQRKYGINLCDFTTGLRFQPTGAKVPTWIDFADTNGLIEITKLLPKTNSSGVTEFLSLMGVEHLHAAKRKAGYVYLFYAPLVGIYKIGNTLNLIERLKSINLGSPCEVVKVWDCFVDDRFELESMLHGKYWRKRLHGEWFALSPEDVKDITSI